jgi:hypothetical protein
MSQLCATHSCPPVHSSSFARDGATRTMLIRLRDREPLQANVAGAARTLTMPARHSYA